VPPTLDFRILGPLEVRAGDLELPLGPAKQRAVLAILLVNLNRVVPTEQLIEQLWPTRAPGRPQTAIQGYVSGLRKVLGRETIETSAAGYVLRADPRHTRCAPLRGAPHPWT
jgi:DNA-binding SARP family transcriptional activator